MDRRPCIEGPFLFTGGEVEGVQVSIPASDEDGADDDGGTGTDRSVRWEGPPDLPNVFNCLRLKVAGMS